jgi:hypothetical protein
MIRNITLLLVCGILGIALAGTATAAQPVITVIDIPLGSDGVDPFVSSLCGFDVEIFDEGRVRITEFSDGSRKVENQRTFYWTANGKSVAEHASYSYDVSLDETTVYHGTAFNLVVPGAGPVLKEAGLVVFDRDGNILRMDGLHQVLDGTDNLPALCDYLSGP